MTYSALVITGPDAKMVMGKVAETEFAPKLEFAVAVRLKVPAVLGPVLEIAPVEELMLQPDGRPLADQLKPVKAG